MIVASTFSLPALRLRPHAVGRALLAGSAWGIGMGIALTALKFHECGMVCLSDVAINTTVAVVAGIVTLGPVAAFNLVRP
jgi:hypothetical protein